MYEVRNPDGTIAKVGIGKAEDVKADGTNRRASASTRKVNIDPAFKNAEHVEVGTHRNISKGQMKEIEAARVRELRNQGHTLPHNREKDRRYHCK
jgi:hypothetical protein